MLNLEYNFFTIHPVPEQLPSVMLACLLEFIFFLSDFNIVRFSGLLHVSLISQACPGLMLACLPDCSGFSRDNITYHQEADFVHDFH